MPEAKNRKLLIARGMSTVFASFNGLPVSVDSAAANSSSFSSISPAILFRRLERSSAPQVDHFGKAPSAARTAFNTSAASDSGMRA
jgi:hypothetical protein